ncbi:UNVERIFIED_CONTAM: hypothetical protein HDU68_006291 [Siphonaria sp. JEL0065]|nr:hypothetical protein HDU68_006291 [Siphonaria sp. JEL0065]
MRTRSKNPHQQITILPVEILLLIFKWIHPGKALLYKRLCRRINTVLEDPRFATTSLVHWIPSGSAELPLTQSRKRVDLDTIWLKWPLLFQSAYITRKFARLTHFIWREDRGLFHNPLPLCITKIQTLTHLILPRNNMIGPIPDPIYSLVHLSVLHLSSNRLTGPLSPLVQQLTNLVTLNLEHNYLDGSIPSEIGFCSNLTKLSLDYNDFSGSIPAFLSQCTRLECIELGYNNLSGRIPQEICTSLSQLETLKLRTNQLSGEIPAEIGELRALQEIYLQENLLSGMIPVEIKSLQSLVLVGLLDGNPLMERKLPSGVERGTLIYEVLKRDGFE